jgi:hypothetical protein
MRMRDRYVRCLRCEHASVALCGGNLSWPLQALILCELVQGARESAMHIVRRGRCLRVKSNLGISNCAKMYLMSVVCRYQRDANKKGDPHERHHGHGARAKACA